MTTFAPDRFEVAMQGGAVTRDGFTYRGLGLHEAIAQSPKGRRAATWSLTHLGSGHCVALITGDLAAAIAVATQIAEAGDWEFLSLEGWRDRFPDAPHKVREIASRNSHVEFAPASVGRSHEVAGQIASGRP